MILTTVLFEELKKQRYDVLYGDIGKEIDVSKLEKKPDVAIPKMNGIIDVGPLRKICKEYIESVYKYKYDDEDFEHYIYETALQCIYGENIWEFIRNNT
jgi:hypothetical protein